MSYITMNYLNELQNKLDNMIYAVPGSIFSWGFELFQNNRLLAVIDTGHLVDGGNLEYDGVKYRLNRNGFLSSGFTLSDDSSTIATAEKTPFARSFRVDHTGRTYTLKAASIFTRKFIVQTEGDTIGVIYPEHPFTRKCIIDLPPDTPIPLQLFMFWLVALMWRRAQNAAAG